MENFIFDFLYCKACNESWRPINCNDWKNRSHLLYTVVNTRLYLCWWQMLETVYDDDKLKMLMDDFKLRPEKRNQKHKNGRRKAWLRIVCFGSLLRQLKWYSFHLYYLEITHSPVNQFSLLWVLTIVIVKCRLSVPLLRHHVKLFAMHWDSCWPN